MNPQALPLFIRRNPRDHDVSVEPRLDRCKPFLETIVQASDLHRVATASRALFAQLREVAWERLQAKLMREAQPRKSMDIAPGCPETRVRYLHTRTVSPHTLFGEGPMSGRTLPCGGCRAVLRPDDRHVGVPKGGTSPPLSGRSTRRWCRMAASRGQPPLATGPGGGPALAGSPGPERSYRPGSPAVASRVREAEGRRRGGRVGGGR
jgi:hypothetical protein